MDNKLDGLGLGKDRVGLGVEVGEGFMLRFGVRVQVSAITLSPSRPIQCLCRFIPLVRCEASFLPTLESFLLRLPSLLPVYWSYFVMQCCFVRL